MISHIRSSGGIGLLIDSPIGFPYARRSAWSLAQDVDRHGGFLDALQAAAVLLDRVARALDLAGAGFAAQLRHQFEELADAGGAERMALRFEAARRIDRDAPAERELAALGGRAAAAERHEARGSPTG